MIFKRKKKLTFTLGKTYKLVVKSASKRCFVGFDSAKLVKVRTNEMSGVLLTFDMPNKSWVIVYDREIVEAEEV